MARKTYEEEREEQRLYLEKRADEATYGDKWEQGWVRGPDGVMVRGWVRSVEGERV